MPDQIHERPSGRKEKGKDLSVVFSCQALKQYNLSTLSVPEYPELSVKNLYSKLKDDAVVSIFVPDYDGKMLPDREFFNKLICTLYPAQMYEIIATAHNNRALERPDNDQELIEIDESIANEIENVILLPSKPLWQTNDNYSEAGQSDPSAKD